MTASPSATADDSPALSKLKELRRKSFRDQAIWFLNTSSVGENPEKCECVRRIEQKCLEVEKRSESEESVLDEFTAHRLLEYSDTPCTVPELRNFIEGIHGNKKRRVSLAELLIYAFDDDWKDLINSSQCNDFIAEKHATEDLEKAKMELSRLMNAAKDGAQAAEDARQSEVIAIQKETEAVRATDTARRAEQCSRELLEKERETWEALDLQEEATRKRKADLEAIVADSKNGIVTRNKANAELAILLSEDPLQLRAARIRQETVMRKSAEALAKCQEAVEHSQVTLQLAMIARAEAIKRKESALAAERSAEDLIPSARIAFEQASKALQEFTERQQNRRGTVFFLHADLNEQRRFLPKSKFIIAQKCRDDTIEKSMSSS
ncbi:hypothetical protein HJC23_008755 [Cyclotella cryptica]|uniref:Uncharacterized protein n=1 Tax=Cyclotella cryptica TaxID=29204 RepID=A0ABD3PDN8_9STRA|eukprot:CCRYP_015665-RA/>CCRYP_015665-RA protein AED:0.12 eAED:0.12 QI:110/1/1/1/1/1/2/7657/379